MNYAAVLAVLMVLAFAFPMLVRIASYWDVPRSSAVITGLLCTILGIAWWWIQAQVLQHREVLKRIEQARQRVSVAPQDHQAYFIQNEHLGDLLLRAGKRREAIEVFEAYRLALPETEQAALMVRIEQLRHQEGG